MIMARICTFVKYKDTESWNRDTKREIFREGKIIWESYDIIAMEEYDDVIWDEIIIVEYPDEEKNTQALKNLAKESRIEKYEAHLFEPYPKEQKERVLKDITENFKLVAFATSEPGMGSDVAGMQCRAEPDGDGFILNGTKYWITNAGHADYISLFAKGGYPPIFRVGSPKSVHVCTTCASTHESLFKSPSQSTG